MSLIIHNYYILSINKKYRIFFKKTKFVQLNEIKCKVVHIRLCTCSAVYMCACMYVCIWICVYVTAFKNICKLRISSIHSKSIMI